MNERKRHAEIEMKGLEALEKFIAFSPGVEVALKNKEPVIALDTTIFGRAGLGKMRSGKDFQGEAPSEIALARVLDILERSGSKPAMTAVVEGKIKVGLEEGELPKVLGTDIKAGTDTIERAVLEMLTATTTISSALWLAEKAGIEVLTTSGIGGVHVDHRDRSADLDALAKYRVVTVAAGMKTFLDRKETVRALQAAGVPILGWQTDDCPAFYSRKTGIKIPQVDTAEEVVARAKKEWASRATGILVAVPIPPEYDIPLVELQPIIDEANASVAARGITDASVTPEVLKIMKEKIGQRLVVSNIALAESNTRVAAKIAEAFRQSK